MDEENSIFELEEISEVEENQNFRNLYLMKYLNTGYSYPLMPDDLEKYFDDEIVEDAKKKLIKYYESNEEKECGVCGKKKDVMNITCGHAYFCNECERKNNKNYCPICRAFSIFKVCIVEDDLDEEFIDEDYIVDD